MCVCLSKSALRFLCALTQCVSVSLWHTVRNGVIRVMGNADTQREREPLNYLYSPLLSLVIIPTACLLYTLCLCIYVLHVQSSDSIKQGQHDTMGTQA